MTLPQPSSSDQEFRYDEDETATRIETQTAHLWNTLPILEPLNTALANIQRFLPNIGDLFLHEPLFYLEIKPWPHAPLIVQAQAANDDLWFARFGFERVITLRGGKDNPKQWLSFGDNGFPIYSYDGVHQSPVVERHGRRFTVYAPNKAEAHKMAAVFARDLTSNYLLSVKSLRDVAGRSAEEAALSIKA